MHPQASVLVVDDESFIRQILSRIVSREGYQVHQASDGKDALKSLAETPCQIVISDIKMPNMDGIELLSEIKANYAHVSVILITAYAGEYSVQDALSAGADAFITKPFKNVEIAETLRNVLVKNLQRQQKAAQTPESTSPK
ncbi:MAG: response regulator [candidate division Zixibacteria bacterium]|nr:response regulator [candidate division Zixibacteria bacterium]MDH3937717.1 response regulator [candidate division Zixibacteria bacterium]MDH4034511.1 response regulator [candidate division Zixibacteria bacterium]